MSYDVRIAALEHRVACLERAPRPADRPALIALELPPLRPGQTRVSLQVWLRGAAVSLVAPGPAVLVDRAELDDPNLAHLIASGDVVAREPTDRELRDQGARRT